MKQSKLKKLVDGMGQLTVKGKKDYLITGLTDDSRKVAPGNLFVAKRGLQYDGTLFIQDAVAAGAAAVLTDIYNPFAKDVTQLLHSDVPAIEAELAVRFFGNPSQSLHVVGITGTNGKTTTAYFAKAVLEGLGKNTGLMGSIEYLLGKSKRRATHTTPSVIHSHQYLREMLDSGCEAAVMEVSSHALSQGRVKGIQFNTAIFTNLSQEHLDYHEDMEDYASSKARIFQELPEEGLAIVNGDSPWTARILRDCKAKILRFGLSKDSDIWASDIQVSLEGTSFTLHYKEDSVRCNGSSLGMHNIYNYLAAALLGINLGATLEEISTILSHVEPIQGRLERADSPAGLHIFIDYAVTPDALENVLGFLKKMTTGRLIVVFGCGGDRDRTKRAPMGAVADYLADHTIITSDNPRSENPAEICADVAKGFTSAQNYSLEQDREKAIQMAVKMAEPGDCLLIAGKGHEKYQYFSHKTIEFDDRAVAEAACKELVSV